eukprot:TRINITY_DN8374_c0_g1_i1.p1 TRINITY_DN8374_c0_g1~~TRINITY_DN8374_c0_g1_i1.p1  ORF type:complete len:806 (-),score=181.51 TRINITY_DN8374_c0_g1_i1:24-2162(-)
MEEQGNRKEGEARNSDDGGEKSDSSSNDGGGSGEELPTEILQAIGRSVLVTGVATAIGSKQLTDFFLTYCGPVTFLAFDRGVSKALALFESEVAMNAALVLARSYIDGNCVRFVAFDPKQEHVLTAHLWRHIEQKQEEEKERQEKEQQEKDLRLKQLAATATTPSENDTSSTAVTVDEFQTPTTNLAEVPQSQGEDLPVALLGIDFESGIVSYKGHGVLYNFRDIAYFPVPDKKKEDHSDSHVLRNCDGRKLRSGIFYRSSCWTRGGMATVEQVREIFEFLYAATHIMTLIDLRAKREKAEDPLDKIVESIYPTMPITSLHSQTITNRRKRFACDLVTRKMQFKGLLWGSTPTSVYFQMMYTAMGRRKSVQVPASASSARSEHVPSLRRAASEIGPFLHSSAPSTHHHRTGGSALAGTSSSSNHNDDSRPRRRRSLATPMTHTTNDDADNIEESESDNSNTNSNHNTNNNTTKTAQGANEPVAVGGEIAAGEPVVLDSEHRGHTDHPSSGDSTQDEEDPEKELGERIEPLLEPEDTEEDDLYVVKEPETMQQVFVQQVMSPMGLLGFSKLLIVHAAREIGNVLRICSNPSFHPLLFHCASGKDRTGLIAALILTVCRVPREVIIDSYHLSELYLSPVLNELRRDNREKGLDEAFDGTPKFVMRQSLEFIEEKSGTIEQWLANECFFTLAEQRDLRNLMLCPPPAPAVTDSSS